MKKLFLFLTLIIGVHQGVNAKQRSNSEMMDKAAKVLSTTTKNRALSTSQLDIIQRRSQLTIIGGQYGFAVLSNDDRFPAVLGYSDKQYIDSEVAPGYLWWLEAINERLEQSMANGTELTSVQPSAEGFTPKVDALLVTEWGQSAPYNNQTPTYKNGKNDVHYVTGCVATAMSQIMYYHRWPEKGKGNISYYFTPEGSDAKQKLTANLAKVPYDWDNMLPIYKGVSYTEAQGEAVAMLMLHCGYSVNMQYTKTGSGAFTADAADALRKRFYYNENMHFYWRDYFPEKEWMQVIFKELSDGCPILYGAQRNDGGHEFVLDGYNEDGLVHVNWGWDGNQNGFFDIASLNGYTTGQEMVLVRKNSELIPFQSYWGLLANSYQVSNISGNARASFTAYNLDYNGFVGKVGIVAKNLTTGKITVMGSNSFTEAIESMMGGNYSFSFSLATLGEGTYRLYPATLSSNETNWQPIRCHETTSNSYIVEINGARISLEKENDPSWTGITPVWQTNEPVRYFDLQGREVDASTRGLLILRQGNVTRKVMR